MAFLTALSGLATMASAAGSLAGVAGTLISYSAQKKAEKLRQAQLTLETQRQKMQVVRDANRQRAIALSSATAQGSQLGSGLAGATSQITGQQNSLTQGINQSYQIGQGMFKANSMDAAGRMISGLGSGLSSLAGSLTDSQERMRRLNEYYA